MHIELATEVLLRSNSVVRERGWSKELAVALGARRHRRDFALASDDDEVAPNKHARNANWGTAQIRAKLFRDCAELCSVWEGKT